MLSAEEETGSYQSDYMAAETLETVTVVCRMPTRRRWVHKSVAESLRDQDSSTELVVAYSRSNYPGLDWDRGDP
jgi:hypothetical protein